MNAVYYLAAGLIIAFAAYWIGKKKTEWEIYGNEQRLQTLRRKHEGGTHE